MRIEAKVKEKEEYFKIQHNPEYKKSLGLTSDKSIQLYINNSPKFGTVSQTLIAKWKRMDTTISLIDVNGDFDMQGYLESNLQSIMTKLMEVITTKGSSRHIDTALKLMGKLVEKKEETIKHEFSPIEYGRITERIIDGFRQQFQAGGICVVCGQSRILPDELRLHTE